MSNQTAQATNSESHFDSKESTCLPFKKRDIEEIRPSYTSSDDLLSLPKNKKQRLVSLQQEAYFNVLQAFSAECPAISSERIMIVKDLKDEWKIPHKTHTDYEEKIKNDPVVQQLREPSLASDEKDKKKVTAASEQKVTAVEGNPLLMRITLKKSDSDTAPANGNGIASGKMPNGNDIAPANGNGIAPANGNGIASAKMPNGNGIAPAELQNGNGIAPAKVQNGNGIAPAKIQDGIVIAPAKIQEEKANSSSTSDDSPVPSWGQVSPETLVGKWVSVRMPGEDVYIAFFIRMYDSKTETHYLETDSCRKDFEDPCNWVDIRHIPTEDITWPEGNPGLPERKCFLNSGKTLLQETSTARNKTQLKEVGKTSTGIPIIKRLDKGKAIVDG